MVAAFASVGSYRETDSATASFAVPSGVEANDIVVIPFYIDGTTVTVTDYNEFEEAENSPILNVGQAHQLHVVWKRATGSDTGPYDLSLSGSGFHAGAALRYTGCITTGSPWDSPTDSDTDPGVSFNAPAVSISTLGADRCVVWAGTSWAINSWTPPTGYTERLDTGFGTVTLADKSQAVSGSTGSVVGVTTTDTRHNAWLGALKPATSEVSGTGLAALGSLTATAAGVRATSGTAVSALGSLMATAVGSVVTPTAMPSAPGGWYGLLSIRKEAEQWAAYEQSQPPVACPHDGEPLRVGPSGVMYCPFDGWRPDN